MSRSCRRSTQQKTIADVLLKESWVAGYFFGCETATESFFGCGTVTDSFLVPKTVGLDQSTGAQQACNARHNIGEQCQCSIYVNKFSVEKSEQTAQKLHALLTQLEGED